MFLFRGKDYNDTFDLRIIWNSTQNVELEIRIGGRIWGRNLKSAQFDRRIRPKVTSLSQIGSNFEPTKVQKSKKITLF